MLTPIFAILTWVYQSHHTKSSCNTLVCSLRTQRALSGVVALHYQHHLEVPQLHTKLSELLDYLVWRHLQLCAVCNEVKLLGRLLNRWFVPTHRLENQLTWLLLVTVMTIKVKACQNKMPHWLLEISYVHSSR